MSSLSSLSGAGIWRRRLSPLLVAGALAALAGCNSQHSLETTGSLSDDYRERHPIVVGEELQVMDIPVGPNSASLSTRMRGTVTGFAQKFGESNGAVLAIVLPHGSANYAAAARMAPQIEATLIGAGVPPAAIERRIYQASPQETQAPIRLAFAALGARTAAPCGQWPDNLADSQNNRTHYNFGCSGQQNLALMVANPLDLMYPRGTSPADPARRGAVLDAYRTGEAYQSDYNKVSGGQVAQGVGQ